MKFLKTSAVALSLGAVFAFSGVSPASATSVPDPDDIFTFDNSMTASNGVTVVTPYGPTCSGSAPCNATTGYGIEDDDGYWQWTSTSARYGGGFSYNPAVNIGNTYTYFVKFKITGQSSTSYNKIVDYLNLADDTGFYIYDNYINFYDLGTGDEEFDDSAVLDLAVVRDSSVTPATFSVYTRTSDGSFVHQLTVEDPDDQSVAYLDGSNHSLLGFFNNDSQYDEGIQSGRVYDLRFWYNTALTEDQLNAFVNPPESGSEAAALASTGFPWQGPSVLAGALLVAGFGAVALRRRRASR